MPRLEDVLATLAATPGARAAVLAGFDGLLVDGALAESPPPAAVDLDGAVVELTHAWNAAIRASTEHLAGGAAVELIVVTDGGVALSHTVGDGWFALLWAAPDVDLPTARAALTAASAALTAVVA
jgi:predicted regulator of Ras-like GTPase activity (Roadblock/LC7/MglB family)